MSSFLQILFYVLTKAPELIGLVQQIMGLVAGLPKSEAQAVKADLSEAVRAGDTHRVKEIERRVERMRGAAAGIPAGLARE